MNHDLYTRLGEITDKIGLFLVSRFYSTNRYACDEVQRKVWSAVDLSIRCDISTQWSAINAFPLCKTNWQMSEWIFKKEC